MPTGGGHGIVEDGTHWHTDHANVLSSVSPLWRPCEDVVQDCKHVAIVTDLLVTSRVLDVWRLVWYLIPHLCEEHADARVRLDEIFELLQHGNQPFGIIVDMVNLFFEPLPVHAAIRWHPATRPKVCQKVNSAWKIGTRD